MKKRVLITVAGGFDGYPLIAAARASYSDVFPAVLPSNNIQHLKEFDIRYVYLNSNKIGLFKEELKKKQYHFIIQASDTTKARKEYSVINAEYTSDLTLGAIATSIKLEKFVFVSNLFPMNMTVTMNDSSPAHPINNYEVGKMLAEQYLSAIKELPLIVMRPITNYYGSGEKNTFILFQTVNKGLESHIDKFNLQISLKTPFSDVTSRSYNVSDGNIYSRDALAIGINE